MECFSFFTLAQSWGTSAINAGNVFYSQILEVHFPPLPPALVIPMKLQSWQETHFVKFPFCKVQVILGVKQHGACAGAPFSMAQQNMGIPSHSIERSNPKGTRKFISNELLVSSNSIQTAACQWCDNERCVSLAKMSTINLFGSLRTNFLNLSNSWFQQIKIYLSGGNHSLRNPQDMRWTEILPSSGF